MIADLKNEPIQFKIIDLQKYNLLYTRFMLKFFYKFHLFSKFSYLCFLCPLLDKVIHLTLKFLYFDSIKDSCLKEIKQKSYKGWTKQTSREEIQWQKKRSYMSNCCPLLPKISPSPCITLIFILILPLHPPRVHAPSAGFFFGPNFLSHWN